MKLLKVPFCSACGKVKDEIGFPQPQKAWLDLRTYRMKYNFRFADLSFTQTYCTDCEDFYRTVRGQQGQLVAAK